jgi:Cys-Gly metallodipeptidase DUG1
VPPQTPQNIDPLVISYVEAEFAKLNSKNKIHVENQHSGKPWLADVDHWNYAAAIKATQVGRYF